MLLALSVRLESAGTTWWHAAPVLINLTGLDWRGSRLWSLHLGLLLFDSHLWEMDWQEYWSLAAVIRSKILWLLNRDYALINFPSAIKETEWFFVAVLARHECVMIPRPLIIDISIHVCLS